MANYQLGPVIGQIGGGVEVQKIPVEAETYGGDSAHLTTINPENERTLIALDGHLDYAGSSSSSFPNIRTNLREEGKATGDVSYAWITSESLTITLVNNSKGTEAKFVGHIYTAPLPA